MPHLRRPRRLRDGRPCDNRVVDDRLGRPTVILYRGHASCCGHTCAHHHGEGLWCDALEQELTRTLLSSQVENIVLGMMLTILPVLLVSCEPYYLRYSPGLNARCQPSQGISQTLIIVRAGLARYMRVHAPSSKHTAIAFAGCSDTEARTELVVNGKECHEDMELVTPHSESPRARPASLQTESERD
jgi:hypothetical protein